ncbi:helicase HerA domain-containing protein [Kordia sp.]|uniref:helicase HerA domain-containing protein n=1 Tax=Kordia sp. TaxID=1965332 RepID=UPI003D6AF441
MKPFNINKTEFLEKIYGELPLEILLSKDKANALDIGEFEINMEEIKSIILENDEAFDYLVEVYNQDFYTRLKRMHDFKFSMSSEIQRQFRNSFDTKRKKLKPVLKIAEKRLEYFSAIPNEDEKSPTLSTHESELRLHKAQFLSQLDHEQTFFFEKSFKALFPYYNLCRHTYCIGASGSGKSELLKIMTYHFSQNKAGCLVLDPHGDLVKDCSFFKHKDEKIIYLSPEFGKFNYYFRYNPFFHEYFDKPEREKQAFISVKASELLNAFAVIFHTEFSENMRRIIYNCLLVLLNTKGSNLRDFMQFLRPATSELYEQLAAQHYNENVRLFFAHDFNQKRLEITKASVLTRFENSLSNYYLAEIFDCKEPSFNLKKSLNDGYTILVNASQGLLGESGCKILGSFLISELTTQALQRANIPEQFRKPWFVVVDELQNFLSDRFDKILSEARKYSLHLVLANQFLQQIENTRLRNSILANTNIKCCGFTSAKDFEVMSKEMGFRGKNVPILGKGKFIIRIGSFKPILIQSYSFLLGHTGSNYLYKEQHRKRLNQTLKTYYTKTESKKQKTASTQPNIPKPIVPLPKPEKLL